jgi:hypothetical protein
VWNSRTVFYCSYTSSGHVAGIWHRWSLAVTCHTPVPVTVTAAEATALQRYGYVVRVALVLLLLWLVACCQAVQLATCNLANWMERQSSKSQSRLN